MDQTQITRLAAQILVGSAAWWLVKQLAGPRAGIVGGVVVLLAHEAFDAPVARHLDRLLAVA